jgi:hypothetical protein
LYIEILQVHGPFILCKVGDIRVENKFQITKRN